MGLWLKSEVKPKCKVKKPATLPQNIPLNPHRLAWDETLAIEVTGYSYVTG